MTTQLYRVRLHLGGVQESTKTARPILVAKFQLAGRKTFSAGGRPSARLAADPRDTTRRRDDDYGSPDVPETWQDEWISGNPRIEQQEPSSQQGTSGGCGGPAGAGINMDQLSQSLAGGMGARDAPALEATSQAAEPLAEGLTDVSPGIGEAADVQDSIRIGIDALVLHG